MSIDIAAAPATVDDLTVFGDHTETKVTADVLTAVLELLERTPPTAPLAADDSKEELARVSTLRTALRKHELAREALARLIISGQLPFIREGDVVHDAAKEVHFRSRRMSTLF